MSRSIVQVLWGGALCAAVIPTAALPAQTRSVPPDSNHWELAGNAQPSEVQGRKCLMMNGAEATVKDLVLRDGVVDVDVATSAKRGFFGIEFRGDSAERSAEWVYLRQHKSGLPDAMQYTPVLHTGLNWQIYSGPGFTGPVEIPLGAWFHLRLEISGAQGKLFVGDTVTPALVMDDLKSGIQRGQLGLAVLTGATCFADFTVRTTPDAPWVRHFPPMPAGTIVRWDLSPSYDALARNLERPLTAAELASIAWQKVEAESPGFVPINRYRDSPHPRVTFQSDFSTRLQPQPGTRVVYARTEITSARAVVKKLELGYSDEVSVFLNGKILWRGRSAQNFRDPGFLGIMSADDDAVYLPLQKGKNDLVLAVSEMGGGWGIVGRLLDVAP